MRRCNQKNCPNEVRNPDHYICVTHWNELVAYVKRVFAGASRAYIGRSYDPEERLRAHCRERGLTHVVVVYSARSAREAMAIEEALISRFDRDEPVKLENISLDSDGSARGGTNYVYVAFALPTPIWAR